MTVKVGINGFGRMGRLVMRVAWDWQDVTIVHINEPAGDAASLAHLLTFDSVHGRWHHEAAAAGNDVLVGTDKVSTSRNTAIEDTDWRQCDIVIESSGVFKSRELLQAYLEQGVQRVVVTAPVKEDGVLNVVMGINQHLYDAHQHPIVTAASCTTNCLAPVVKVLHESLGIVHGSMTTIHDITNTQTIVDKGHKDLRRARSCGQSLIPTSTGSAKAITKIFPELEGKLNGMAVRVPLLNASLTDLVIETERKVTAEEVNALFQEASENELQGILGYEERPLVSIDYTNDSRSSIIDAPSTMVINGTQVKLYVWYDNEWGYVNRMMELAQKVSLTL